MPQPTPTGITPPAPGQDKEEPDLWQEDDIPVDNDDLQAHHPVAEDPPQR